jgi:hypothetical protein
MFKGTALMPKGNVRMKPWGIKRKKPSHTKSIRGIGQVADNGKGSWTKELLGKWARAGTTCGGLPRNIYPDIIDRSASEFVISIVANCREERIRRDG